MRKLFLLFFILSCIPLWSQYSGFKRPELQIGTTQGAVGSFANFTPTINQGFVLGYAGGVSLRYITEKYFGVQVDVNYSQRGFSEAFETPDLYYMRKLDYIQIPLLTYVYVGQKWARGYMLLGPQIGINIRDEELTNLEVIDRDDYDQPIWKNPDGSIHSGTRPYNKKLDNIVDWGITAGLGVEFRTKVGNFGLEARYTFGLGDIYSANKGELFQGSSIQTIMVNFVYMYDIYMNRGKKKGKRNHLNY